MAGSVKVHIDCPCPGTPHDAGDDVFLRPNPGAVGGTMIYNRYIQILNDLRDRHLAGQVLDEVDQEEVTAKVAQVSVRVGIEAWTLVKDDGSPLEVSPGAIRDVLEANFYAWREVSDVADGLYTKPVLGPLLARARQSSPRSRTTGSTSATPGRRSNGSRAAATKRTSSAGSSPTPRPKRSKRSSTSTTPTGGTVTITSLPAGGSS